MNNSVMPLDPWISTILGSARCAIGRIWAVQFPASGRGYSENPRVHVRSWQGHVPPRGNPLAVRSDGSGPCNSPLPDGGILRIPDHGSFMAGPRPAAWQSSRRGIGRIWAVQFPRFRTGGILRIPGFMVRSWQGHVPPRGNPLAVGLGGSGPCNSPLPDGGILRILGFMVRSWQGPRPAAWQSSRRAIDGSGPCNSPLPDGVF